MKIVWGRAPTGDGVASLPAPDDGSNGARWRWHGPFTLVALAVIFNLWSLRGERLRVVYPNDSGMHLQMTTMAMDLLRHGISPYEHWYPLLSLGSSFFVQYQSFSAVLTGALSILFGPATTYAWSLYLLLSLWPVCVYWSTRLFAWGRWEAALAAALAPLLFSVTGRGFGHQSYVWIGSGLWSQLWAMWTLPLAWGFSWRYVTQRKSLVGAVVTLSLTIAFHFLSAYLAALTLAVWIVIRPSQFVARAVRALFVGVLALLATAWVTLPLLVHAKWLAVNQFQVGTSIDNSYGARRALGWLVTGQLYDWQRFPVITILVGVGLVVGVHRWTCDERGRALVGAWLLSLFLFFGRTTWGVLLDVLPGNQNLLFQRYIMGLHLAGVMLAGVGGVALIDVVAAQGRRHAPRVAARVRHGFLARRAGLRAALVVLVAVVALAPAWTQIAAYDHLSASWIAQQRRATSTAGAELDSLVTLAESRGGGRIYAGMPSNWGRHFYVGAVPVYIYLEQLNVDAVGFTLRTSGLMTDPEAYFDESRPGDYAAFGVRYLILPAGRRPPIAATLLRSAGSYRLWQVQRAQASALIQVVDTYGVIAANRADLGTQTRSFLTSSLPERGVYPSIAYDGAGGARATLTSPTSPHGAPGIVTRQSQDLVGAQRAQASVVITRPAVVLLKVAYDPGWRVTVDGRATPTVMLAPALVGVEVPPGRHLVIFTFHGYGDYGLLDAVAAITLLGVAGVPWWWRRRAR